MTDECEELKLTPVSILAATCESAAALSKHVWFEGRSPLPSHSNKTRAVQSKPSPRECYACGKPSFSKRHGFYDHMCAQCGQTHFEKLYNWRHVGGLSKLDRFVCLVIGGRTKIGYQVVLRMLRSGAVVFCTTRFPERCVFDREPDCESWLSRLVVLPLDLNQPARKVVEDLEVRVLPTIGLALDGLIIVAAQTIRGIERRDPAAGAGSAGKGKYHGHSSFDA